jgi:carbonic anhydrase/acetyltransferase-like protein (isoleucine patch superfamily)
VVGAVSLAARTTVFYGAVLRADGDAIDIGTDSNIQDHCVLHADPGLPVRVGNRVSVGHRAALHGCVVEDDVLVGIGAIVLNGAVIGAGSLIAAGAVVLEGMTVPPASLVAGVPGQVRRSLSQQEMASVAQNAAQYVELGRLHALASPA